MIINGLILIMCVSCILQVSVTADPVLTADSAVWVPSPTSAHVLQGSRDLGVNMVSYYKLIKVY